MKSVVATAIIATLAVGTQSAIVYKQTLADKTADFKTAIALAENECGGVIKASGTTVKGPLLFAVDETLFIAKKPCYDAVKDFVSTTAPTDADKCFTTTETTPPVYSYKVGGAPICPLATSATCAVGQFCQPTNIADASVACDEAKKYCPYSKVDKLMKVEVEFGENYQEPDVIAFQAHFVAAMPKDSTACLATSTYITPANAKGTQIINYFALDYTTSYKECKPVMEQAYKDAETTYNADDTIENKVTIKVKSTGETNFQSECFDDKTNQILCKEENEKCSIKCKDGTDCSAEEDKDICGGECVETVADKRVCATSGASQLFAGVVAVAALAVAFF